jgi:hypothetical protein
MSNKRVIIGSESDDSLKIELVDNGTLVALPVTMVNSSGSQVDLATETTLSAINGKITACDTSSISATDLDIRDLYYVNDSVECWQSTAANLNMTEANSGAILADTASMDTNLATVAGAVSGSEMQVDIVADGAGLALAANQLPDGHNVTIDNAAGGSAVNIQDGGNTITVDGTVTATPSGTQDVDVVANSIGLATSANQLPDGHNVTIDNAAGGSAVNVQDGGNSLTVDAPTGTPVNVQVGDGTNQADILQNADDDSTPEDQYGLVTSSVLYGRVSSSDIRPLRADSATNSLQTIDYAHHEIHGGSHFYVADYTDLGSGSTYNIVIATPNTTKWAHLVFEFNHELETTIVITEGISTDADGTAITEVNNDRNSATTATTVFTHTPTNPTGGTVIWQQRLGSGRKEGGGSRNDNEIILKQNTKYLVAFTNNSGSASSLTNWWFEWYEHTNKT